MKKILTILILTISLYTYGQRKEANKYISKGIAKTRLQDYNGAIADYSKAIKLDSNWAMTYYNRGLAKIEIQDYRGAILDFNIAEDIEPYYCSEYAYLYTNRGIAKVELQDYWSALDDYNKAIKLDSNCTDAYYNRGIVKFDLGDVKGAYLDLSKAGEKGYSKAYDLIREYIKLPILKEIIGK